MKWKVAVTYSNLHLLATLETLLQECIPNDCEYNCLLHDIVIISNVLVDDMEKVYYLHAYATAHTHLRQADVILP